MNKLASHIRYHRRHRLTALVVTFVYLAMLCLPLATYAMSLTGSTLTRECSGDCSLCGCSPASSATGTCCCAKKRSHQNHIHETEDSDTPDCCNKEQGETKETVIACGSPCGPDQHVAISILVASEALPCHFSEVFSVATTATVYSPLPHRPASRDGEPPDPPPKLSLLS